MKLFQKLILFVSLLFVPIAFFFIPRLIQINRINCRSQYGECSTIVKDDLDSTKKESLNKTKKEIENKLRSEFSIRDFQVYFKIPGTLDVDVIEKISKFSLTTDGHKYALVDKDGYVLFLSDSTDLPGIISQESLPQKGGSVSQENLFALNIMYDVFSLYQIKEGKIDGRSLVIELPDDLRVIFPLEGNRQELVGEFMLLYNEVRSRDDKKMTKTTIIKEIDLRFKNPILR